MVVTLPASGSCSTSRLVLVHLLANGVLFPFLLAFNSRARLVFSLFELTAEEECALSVYLLEVGGTAFLGCRTEVFLGLVPRVAPK